MTTEKRTATLPCPLLLARPGRGGGAARQHELLLGRQLEHIPDQQIRVVLCVALDTRRQRPAKDPVVPFLAEEARGHGCAGDNAGRIEDPAERPGRLQPLARKQEVRRRGVFVVRRVASGVALQAWCRRAGEELPRYGAFGVGQWLKLGR